MTLPAKMMMVTGSDARKAEAAISGLGENPNMDAVMIDYDDNTVYVEYIAAGYVTGDDWTEMDAASLLRTIKENTVAANVKRRAAGIPAHFVDGWIWKPTFDHTSGTVFWAINAHDENGTKFVNAIALRLGRNGYTKLTFVPDDVANIDAIYGIKDLHEFDTGFRYADYVTGDKLAGFGVASLVAAHAGGKISKGWGAVIAGVFLMLAKKAWFVLLLPFAFIGKLFRRKKRVLEIASSDTERAEPHF
jgi:uncharacterized membrane-anchored protein